MKPQNQATWGKLPTIVKVILRIGGGGLFHRTAGDSRQKRIRFYLPLTNVTALFMKYDITKHAMSI
jgi:hypothetical protein